MVKSEVHHCQLSAEAARAHEDGGGGGRNECWWNVFVNGPLSLLIAGRHVKVVSTNCCRSQLLKLRIEALRFGGVGGGGETLGLVHPVKCAVAPVYVLLCPSSLFHALAVMSERGEGGNEEHDVLYAYCRVCCMHANVRPWPSSNVVRLDRGSVFKCCSVGN